MPNYIEEIKANDVVYQVRDRDSTNRLGDIKEKINTLKNDISANEPKIAELRGQLIAKQTSIETINEEFEKYIHLLDAVLGGELVLTEGVHYGTTLPGDIAKWKPVIPYIGTDTEWKRCV